MARSSTEWARKMPMMVGIIYGLDVPGARAVAAGPPRRGASPRATRRSSCSTRTRTDGAEHIFRWRAEVLAAAGKAEAARAATRAPHAEVDAKAAKLRDPELRKHFLATRQRAVLQ